jgi:hypothetical protein
METNDESINTPAQKTNIGVALWAIAAFITAIVTCAHNTSAMVLGAGFFAKCFAVIVGTILGLLGALAGDAIRRFARPDFILTNGGFAHLIWIKIFWRIGPQLVGLFLGVVLGSSLVLR